jgi:hypothetical protein
MISYLNCAANLFKHRKALTTAMLAITLFSCATEPESASTNQSSTTQPLNASSDTIAAKLTAEEIEYLESQMPSGLSDSEKQKLLGKMTPAQLAELRKRRENQQNHP